MSAAQSGRRIALALGLALAALPACAEVVAAIASERSHGQAWTFRMPHGCFAALPAHVAQSESGEPSALLLRSRSGREGQGLEMVQPDPQLDLVFVRVVGMLASPCGSAENLGVDNLDYTLGGEAGFTLRVTRTRSLQQIPMRVSRSNRTYANFALTSDQPIDEIAQSMSGGVIVAGEEPVAMLLSVNNDDGLVQGLRFDVIKRLARNELTRTAADSPPAKPSDLFQVAGWHGESVEAGKPPTAVLSGGVWRVKPVARRVELTLHPAGPVRLSRVLVARTPVQAEEPDLLSVWSSGKPGADWVLLKTCPKRGGSDGPLFECAVAPVEVGALRLDFAQRANASVLSIGAIELR